MANTRVGLFSSYGMDLNSRKRRRAAKWYALMASSAYLKPSWSIIFFCDLNIIKTLIARWHAVCIDCYTAGQATVLCMYVWIPASAVLMAIASQFRTIIPIYCSIVYPCIPLARYIDFMAGFGATVLGYAHPVVDGAAAAAQARYGPTITGPTECSVLLSEKVTSLRPGATWSIFGTSSSFLLPISLVRRTGQPQQPLSS